MAAQLEHAVQATFQAMERIRGNRRTETLDFIQAHLGQLRDLAAAERLDMLTYLIEMAYVEASDIIRGDRPPRTPGIGGNVQ